MVNDTNKLLQKALDEAVPREFKAIGLPDWEVLMGVCKVLSIDERSNPIEAILCKLAELQGRVEYYENHGMKQPLEARYKQPPLRHVDGSIIQPGEKRR